MLDRLRPDQFQQADLGEQSAVRIITFGTDAQGGALTGAIWFRIASVLIALFASGHNFGFRQTDSKWGLDSALAAIRTIQFTTQGFTRTHWDFYVGFGLFVTVFLALAAFLTWQLGSVPASSYAVLRPLALALTVSFAIVAVLGWRFFFLAPQ